MERSQSMPAKGTGALVNPFHSRRVQEDYLLDAARPTDLPAEPLESHLSGDSFQVNGPTGKGCGNVSAGFADASQPTRGPMELRTEGELPKEGGGSETMGPVSESKGGRNQKGELDGLQRALEGELVEFLRQQNAQLMDELASLRGKVEKGHHSKPTSGMESSPWSAVDGSANSSNANGFVGTLPPERHGRHGSRTPRSKIRDVAISPERRDPKHFTPNGTRVPDGPPPGDGEAHLLPVPPFPRTLNGGQPGEGVDSSFESALYDTCDSKGRVRNVDTQWKPQCDRNDRDGVMSASEAKQFWLEKEVQSLGAVLNKVSVPSAFHESGYWNGGFEGKVEPPINTQPAHASCTGTDLGVRALHGGSGAEYPQDRASACAPSVPCGVRAAYLHGASRTRSGLVAWWISMR